MLALQALTPERLAAAVPVISLAEARKLVAQVHRGEAIAPTSARSTSNVQLPTSNIQVSACGFAGSVERKREAEIGRQGSLH